MSKFKVGDRVIYSGDSSYYVTKNYIGKKGNISALVPHGKQMFYNVIFDDGTLGREVDEDNLSSISSGSSKIYTEQTIKIIKAGHYCKNAIEITEDYICGNSVIKINFWNENDNCYSKEQIGELAETFKQIHEVMR